MNPLASIVGVGAVSRGQLTPAAATTQTFATPKVDGPSFGSMFADALESVSDTERAADTLVQRLASGEDVPVHQVMVATAEAQLAVDTVVVFRDQALTAYNQIMNIPL